MKKINIFTLLIVLSSIIIYGLVTTLPDIVPVHINIDGDVDKLASKWLVLLGPVIAIITAIATQLYLRKSTNKSLESLQTMMTIILACLLVISWIFYILAFMADSLNFNIIMGIFFGIIFLFMGNYSGQIKTNNVVGIRVKWTMSNEETWQKPTVLVAC